MTLINLFKNRTSNFYRSYASDLTVVKNFRRDDKILYKTEEDEEDEALFFLRAFQRLLLLWHVVSNLIMALNVANCIYPSSVYYRKNGKLYRWRRRCKFSNPQALYFRELFSAHLFIGIDWIEEVRLREDINLTYDDVRFEEDRAASNKEEGASGKGSDSANTDWFNYKDWFTRMFIYIRKSKEWLLWATKAMRSYEHFMGKSLDDGTLFPTEASIFFRYYKKFDRYNKVYHTPPYVKIDIRKKYGRDQLLGYSFEKDGLLYRRTFTAYNIKRTRPEYITSSADTHYHYYTQYILGSLGFIFGDKKYGDYKEVISRFDRFWSKPRSWIPSRIVRELYVLSMCRNLPVVQNWWKVILPWRIKARARSKDEAKDEPKLVEIGVRFLETIVLGYYALNFVNCLNFHQFKFDITKKVAKKRFSFIKAWNRYLFSDSYCLVSALYLVLKLNKLITILMVRDTLNVGSFKSTNNKFIFVLKCFSVFFNRLVFLKNCFHSKWKGKNYNYLVNKEFNIKGGYLLKNVKSVCINKPIKRKAFNKPQNGDAKAFNISRFVDYKRVVLSYYIKKKRPSFMIKMFFHRVSSECAYAHKLVRVYNGAFYMLIKGYMLLMMWRFYKSMYIFREYYYVSIRLCMLFHSNNYDIYTDTKKLEENYTTFKGKNVFSLTDIFNFKYSSDAFKSFFGCLEVSTIYLWHFYGRSKWVEYFYTTSKFFNRKKISFELIGCVANGFVEKNKLKRRLQSIFLSRVNASYSRNFISNVYNLFFYVTPYFYNRWIYVTFLFYLFESIIICIKAFTAIFLRKIIQIRSNMSIFFNLLNIITDWLKYVNASLKIWSTILSLKIIIFVDKLYSNIFYDSWMLRARLWLKKGFRYRRVLFSNKLMMFFHDLELGIGYYCNSNVFIFVICTFRLRKVINSAKLWCEYIIFNLRRQSRKFWVYSIFKKLARSQGRSNKKKEFFMLGETLRLPDYYVHKNCDKSISNYRYPLRGIRIRYAGTLKKGRRKRRIKYQTWLSRIEFHGPMPLNTFKAYIEYYQSRVSLFSSTVGVKVWMYYFLE
jgi:hypothetical protein